MYFKKGNLLFYGSLALAIWFAITASAWTYLMNGILALPAGIVSWILWRKGRKTDHEKQRYRVIPVIWIIGSSISFLVLCWMLL